MNCPFYGHAIFLAPSSTQRPSPPFILFGQRGNQCAIVTTSHAPCLMEMEGKKPDWIWCPLVREMRMESEP